MAEEIALTNPVVRIDWPDQSIGRGKLDALRAKCGINTEAALRS